MKITNKLNIHNSWIPEIITFNFIIFYYVALLMPKIYEPRREM